jgi:hypothetical protein
VTIYSAIQFPSKNKGGIKIGQSEPHYFARRYGGDERPARRHGLDSVTPYSSGAGAINRLQDWAVCPGRADPRRHPAQVPISAGGFPYRRGRGSRQAHASGLPRTYTNRNRGPPRPMGSSPPRLRADLRPTAVELNQRFGDTGQKPSIAQTGQLSSLRPF